MADENDPFAGINLVDESAQPAVRTTPLTMEERLIVQNIFDTQPARRAQYMKQLGFEIDPNDTNKYRPLGSDLEFQAEIDPGTSILFAPGGLKEKVKAVAAETGKDILDLVGDAASSLLSTGAQQAGAALGRGAGSAAGPKGMIVGTVIGGITGGALGQQAAEEAKTSIGDLYLDANIPPDRKIQAVQAVIAGVAPVMIQKGAKVAKQGFQGLLSMRANAIANAAKSAGGGVTDDLLAKATQNPEMFTKEAVEGATERLGKTYKDIFGIADDKAITPKSTRALAPDSLFGKAVAPLNKDATEEVAKLAKMPEANWKASDLIGPLNSKIDELASKFSRTAEEDAAFKYLKGAKAEIENKAKSQLSAMAKSGESSITSGGITLTSKNAKPRAPSFSEDKIANTEFNFKQGREFLKKLQDDAFDREVPGSGYLKQYAGGLRQLADEKAGALGSKLPEINAKRSQILGLFDQAKSAITPQKLTSAFIGDDTIAKQDTQLILKAMEDMGIAPGVSNAIESGAMQRVLENAYKNPKAFGSGRVQGAMISEGLAGGVKGGLGGAAVGSMVGAPQAGALVGGVTGLARGVKQGAMMARPEVAIPALAENLAKQRALQAAIEQPLAQQASIPVQQAGQTMMRNIVAPEAIKPEDDDPFRDIEF